MQLAGIRKCFDGKEVIPQLDLTINNGEFLTLFGPSGCGKTTVLRLIAGLETVDSGRIMLDNEDITHVPAENRYVNTVFQSYTFPHMTVFENVAFGLRMQKPPLLKLRPRDGSPADGAAGNLRSTQTASALWWSTATRRHCPRGG